MQPKIESVISRLKYVLDHPDRFDTPIIPIYITLAKLAVEFNIEVLQMYLIFYLNDCLFLIMCFAGYIALNNVDMEYFHSIESPLKHKIEHDNF